MNEQAVVSWQEKLAESAKAVAQNEQPTSSVISLRSGIMNYNGTIVPGNKLQCVVVAYSFERTFYPGKWNPDVIVPPECFALSLTGDDMVPHDKSKTKQHDACEGCQQNTWQANPDRPGKKNKPCKERRRLILMPAADIKDGAIAKAELALMSIPVTSKGNWANYVNLCASGYQRPPWAMLTEISVHPHMTNQFEVKFDVAGQVTEQYLGEIEARIAAAEELAMTPYEPQAEAPAEKVEERSDKKKKY